MRFTASLPCLTVGLSNMINRFHATFRTDVDTVMLRGAEAGDTAAGSCPIARPKAPQAARDRGT